MNENVLEKRIVYINSSNCKYIDATKASFFYNLLDPIRDAVYIKIMKAEVIVNPSNNINNVKIEDGDPIFVNMNNYNRLYASVRDDMSKDPDNDSKNVKCFECISLNITDKYGGGTVPTKLVSFKTEYTATGCSINDTNTYILDPVEPNLKRLDITLYDKKYNLINKADINVFNMILCIYSNKKKITMM